jgi:tripartite-type tricarboxylate transporter receptor subunit TctC
MRGLLRAAVVAIGIACVVTPYAAKAFPTKPVKIVVPYAAGGGPDVQVRILGPRLAEALGQPVVIENRGSVRRASSPRKSSHRRRPTDIPCYSDRTPI